MPNFCFIAFFPGIFGGNSRKEFQPCLESERRVHGMVRVVKRPDGIGRGKATDLFEDERF